MVLYTMGSCSFLVCDYHHHISIHLFTSTVLSLRRSTDNANDSEDRALLFSAMPLFKSINDLALDGTLSNIFADTSDYFLSWLFSFMPT